MSTPTPLLPQIDGAQTAPATATSRRPITRRRLSSWLVFVLMALIAFSTVYPIVFAVNSALKTQQDWIAARFTVSIPPSFDQIHEAWRRSEVPRTFANSLIVTFGGIVGAWIVCSPAAFAATKMRFRGRNLLFILLLASMMIPMQTILYPFFVQMRDLQLVNTYRGLILAYVAFAVPITTYQMAAYFRSIPNDVIDAAKLDGASTLKTLTTIVLPMARPVLATTGIINSVWMWNDLLLPLMVMQRPDHQTLIVSLSLLRGQYGADPTLIAAGVAIGIAPIVVVYLIAQEHLIKGMTQGAVK